MEEIRCSIEEFPRYYDVAFGADRWLQSGHQYSIYVECNFLKQVFEKYALKPVKSVLELGCGPAYHPIRLAQMGYETAGLDIKQKMIDYARKQAVEKGVKVEFFQGDIRNFRLPRKFDACIITLDLIRLLLTNDEIVSHFCSVAEALNEGGLYVVEYAHPKEMLGLGRTTTPEWTTEAQEIKITCKFALTGWDFEKQTTRFIEEYVIEEKGKKFKIYDEGESRILLPKELLALVQLSGKFEFCNFYGAYGVEIGLNHEKAWRTIAILRKPCTGL
jgi:SAM-dependent methyltransferase